MRMPRETDQASVSDHARAQLHQKDEKWDSSKLVSPDDRATVVSAEQSVDSTQGEFSAAVKLVRFAFAKRPFQVLYCNCYHLRLETIIQFSSNESTVMTGWTAFGGQLAVTFRKWLKVGHQKPFIESFYHSKFAASSQCFIEVSIV